MFPRPNRRLSAIQSHRCVRRRALDFDLVPVLAPAGVETAFLVEAAIGMGAEIVAQALQQVRWAPRAPQSVVIGKRRRESRRRHAVGDRQGKHTPPRALRPYDPLAEVIVEQEVGELWIAVIGFLDAIKEARAGDAPVLAR